MNCLELNESKCFVIHRRKILCSEFTDVAEPTSIASFCFKTLLKKLHNNGLGQMGFEISGGGIRIYMVGYYFAHATGGHIIDSIIDIWSTPDVII